MASIQPIRPAEFSEEWRVRCDLAACYRAFVKFGWTDLIYTHISARHPTDEGCYLINPYGLLFEEITASNLIVVDFEGNVVRGDYPYNDAGHAIHSVVLMHRPDVHWVLHSHTRAGMAVSCMKGGLLPLTQQAMLFDGRLSYHEYDHQTVGSEEVREACRGSREQQRHHPSQPRVAHLRADRRRGVHPALQPGETPARCRSTCSAPGWRPSCPSPRRPPSSRR